MAAQCGDQSESIHLLSPPGEIALVRYVCRSRRNGQFRTADERLDARQEGSLCARGWGEAEGIVEIADCPACSGKGPILQTDPPGQTERRRHILNSILNSIRPPDRTHPERSRRMIWWRAAISPSPRPCFDFAQHERFGGVGTDGYRIRLYGDEQIKNNLLLDESYRRLIPSKRI